MSQRCALLAVALGLGCGSRTGLAPPAVEDDGGAGESAPVGPCGATTGILTLASGQPGPFGIAVDSRSVYWTDIVAGTVMSVPLCGGAAMTIATGQRSPFSLAVDASAVYWTNALGGAVMRASKAGGAPITVATGQGIPEGIAVDTTSVYWVDRSAGTVMKAPLGGGTSQTLASHRLEPAAVAVDPTSVYWAEYKGCAVAKVSLGGGPVKTLYNECCGCKTIAVDATAVYTSDGTAVLRVPLDGGPATALACGYAIVDVVVDAPNVYWVDQWGPMGPPGYVNRAPEGRRALTSGACSTTLASNQDDPGFLTVDATSVYWATAHAVMKLTPK